MNPAFRRRILLSGAVCLGLGVAWVRADRLNRQEAQLEGKNAEELLKVKTVIDKAIAEDPGNSELWVHLGMVNRKLDRVEDAQAAFEKAAALNPKNANAHFMLGLIHEKMKRTDKALASWAACRDAAGEQSMREVAERHIKQLEGR